MRTQVICLTLAIVLVCPFASAQWVQTNGPYGDNISSFAVSGTNLFAWGSGGVYLSTNSGTSWSQTGLGPYSVYALAVSGTNLYAGTGSGAWKRPLSEVVSVMLVSSGLPTEFILAQNYPNPFNPSTAIKYGLPKSSEVRLSVYEVLGRQVSMLVNEKRDAGVHEVKFDGTNLASGVYFYRLQAGDFVQTNKLMILK